MKTDTLSLLKTLITFRTTADRIGEIDKALTFIEKTLKPHGIWTTRLILASAKRPVLYACTQKTKTPEVMLVSHVDVVEGESDQFKPYVSKGRLFGRGASDCKNHAAASIAALIHFAKSGKSVGAYFSTDEEIGGPTTTLLASKGFIGKRTLLLDAERATVFRQKGILNLRVSVNGKSCHGSMPWLGENANEKLMTAYAKIKKLFPATTPKDRWKETVNLGIMNGGDVINKVADSAEMQLNIRLTEKGDHNKIVAAIKKIKEVDNVEVLGYHGFVFVDPKSAVVQEFKRIMEKEIGAAMPLDSMHGATDAHNFAGKKTAIIITGMGAGKNIHGKDESLDISALEKFTKALIAYLAKTM